MIGWQKSASQSKAMLENRRSLTALPPMKFISNVNEDIHVAIQNECSRRLKALWVGDRGPRGNPSSVWGITTKSCCMYTRHCIYLLIQSAKSSYLSIHHVKWYRDIILSEHTFKLFYNMECVLSYTIIHLTDSYGPSRPWFIHSYQNIYINYLILVGVVVHVASSPLWLIFRDISLRPLILVYSYHKINDNYVILN